MWCFNAMGNRFNKINRWTDCSLESDSSSSLSYLLANNYCEFLTSSVLTHPVTICSPREGSALCYKVITYFVTHEPEPTGELFKIKIVLIHVLKYKNHSFVRASCVHFFKQTRLGTLLSLCACTCFLHKNLYQAYVSLRNKKSPKKKIKQYKLFYYFSLSEEATASVAVAQVVRRLLKTWAWLKLPYNQKEKDGLWWEDYVNIAKQLLSCCCRHFVRKNTKYYTATAM